MVQSNGMEGGRTLPTERTSSHSEGTVGLSRGEFHVRPTKSSLRYLGVVEPLHRCLFKDWTWPARTALCWQVLGSSKGHILFFFGRLSGLTTIVGRDGLTCP